MSLTSTMNSDVASAPSPHDKQNQMSYPTGSPAKLSGPFQGDFRGFHEAQPESLGVAVMEKTLDGHKPAKLETPFETDFRPGFNSHK